jgi:hypothetical protein
MEFVIEYRFSNYSRVMESYILPLGKKLNTTAFTEIQPKPESRKLKKTAVAMFVKWTSSESSSAKTCSFLNAVINVLSACLLFVPSFGK